MNGLYGLADPSIGGDDPSNYLANALRLHMAMGAPNYGPAQSPTQGAQRGMDSLISMALQNPEMLRGARDALGNFFGYYNGPSAQTLLNGSDTPTWLQNKLGLGADQYVP